MDLPSSGGARCGVAPRHAGVEARLRLGARGALAAALLLPATTSCYTYAAPATLADAAAPAPGHVVELTLNDAGRVGMTPALGPGVLRVEGTLTASPDSGYVVSVTRVDAIGGVTSWTGDTVRVRRDYVAGVAERRLSRGRTAVATAALVAVVAFVARLSLNGIGGNGGGGTKLPPDTGGT